MILTRKKRKKMGLLIGGLWYYIKKIDDVKRFAEAADFLVSLCVELGIDWKTVEIAETVYAEVMKHEEEPEVEQGQ